MVHSYKSGFTPPTTDSPVTVNTQKAYAKHPSTQDTISIWLSGFWVDMFVGLQPRQRKWGCMKRWVKNNAAGSLELSSGDLSDTHKKAFRVCLHSTQRNWTVLLDRPPAESIPVGQVKQCQHLVLIVVEVMLSAEISLLSFYSCFSVSRAPPTPDHTL